MRSFITYTAARLLLFVAAFGLVYMLGGRGLVALVIALVISGLASYVLLAGQRDAMSGSIVKRINLMRSAKRRLDEGAAKEDAAESSSGDASDTAPGDTAEDDAANLSEADEPSTTRDSQDAAHDTPRR